VNLTSKSRYALKIMLDLAHHAHEAHVHRRDIAKRQGIPTDYLDQIMIRLRKGGLVESVRGRGGGYRLAKDPASISIWDLLLVAEGNLDPVQCLATGEGCGFDISCISHDAWSKIYIAMRQPLEQMMLGDLVLKDLPIHQLCPAGGIRECKAPNSAAKQTVFSLQ
jgi:Rrf2 family protein